MEYGMDWCWLPNHIKLDQNICSQWYKGWWNYPDPLVFEANSSGWSNYISRLMPLYTLNKLPLLIQDIFQKSHIIRHLLKFVCEGNVDVQLFEDFKKFLKLWIKLSLLSLSGKGTFGACFGAASSFLLGIAIRDANTSFSSCDPLPELGIAILVSFTLSFSIFPKSPQQLAPSSF